MNPWLVVPVLAGHRPRVRPAAGRDRHGGLAPGAPLPRCRLCELPNRDIELAPEALAHHVLAAISRDFPSWRVADGLCSRCAELYTSHAAMRS